MPRAVGIDQAAKLLSLSKRTVWKYISEGEIRSVRAGRRILLPMDSLDKFLK